jgi:hypothetical protein
VSACEHAGLSPESRLVEVHAGLVEAEGTYGPSGLPSERQIWSRDDLMRRVWSRVFLDQPRRTESPGMGPWEHPSGLAKLCEHVCGLVCAAERPHVRASAREHRMLFSLIPLRRERTMRCMIQSSFNTSSSSLFDESEPCGI